MAWIIKLLHDSRDWHEALNSLMLGVNQPSLLLPWAFIAFSVGIINLGLKVNKLIQQV